MRRDSNETAPPLNVPRLVIRVEKIVRPGGKTRVQPVANAPLLGAGAFSLLSEIRRRCARMAVKDMLARLRLRQFAQRIDDNGRAYRD
jgi:hypothetical protein